MKALAADVWARLRWLGDPSTVKPEDRARWEDWQYRCPVCDADRCPLCGAHGGYCGAGCPEGNSEVPPGPPLCDRCGTALTEAPDHPGDPDVLQACGHCGSDSTAAGYER